MCDHPACPDNGGQPLPINDETEPMMRVEASSAALHCLSFVAKGWMSASHGLLQDQSAKWGFPGVTRMAWVMATACSILPKPADSPVTWSSPASMEERLTDEDGNPVPKELIAHLTVVSDQAQSAFKELVALSTSGTEDAFATRFDTITDQENLIQPLLAGLMANAGVHFVSAHRDGHTAALDQFQAAVRAGLPLDDEDDQVDHLKALYDLPDAPER